jgi:hypothetical protein
VRILFYTHSYPNYVPDLLLHGLRKLLGPDVIDYPRKDCLYRGVLGLGVCPDGQLCPGWFPSDDGSIDREDIWGKVQRGYFTYIVCDCRALADLLQRLIAWPAGLVVIDGEDVPARIPPGRYVICRRETDGSDFSIPLPMALPEEILRWIGSYDRMPKEYSIGFLGSSNGGNRQRVVETIGKFYPDALLGASLVPSDGNPAPTGRLGRNQYYLNLQKCRIVLSLPGAGYDTFRFWENAAANAIHLAAKLPIYIPRNFSLGIHMLWFDNLHELRRMTDAVLNEKIKADELVGNGRRWLMDYHLTTRRAEYFLDRIRMGFAQ